MHPRCDSCQASSQLKGVNSAYERARTRTNEYRRAPADNEVIHRNFSGEPTNGTSGPSAGTGAVRASCPRDPCRPDITETDCEEFLYPVKEPGRKRSTEPSGAHLPVHSVRLPGRRRPSACAGQDRHQWISVIDVGGSVLRQRRTVGFSHPIFIADRQGSTVRRSGVKHLCF